MRDDSVLTAGRTQAGYRPVVKQLFGDGAPPLGKKRAFGVSKAVKNVRKTLSP
jgi:hypothetical protein